MPKSPSPAQRFGAPPDGVALFWRAARLEPAAPPAAAPFARADGGPGGGGGGGGGPAGGAMTQGAIVATLRDRAARGRALVVAATHLKAKDGGPNDETRRRQALQLLERVEAAVAAAAAETPVSAAAAAGDNGSSTTQQQRQPPPPGVVVAGDFNALRSSPACAAVVAHPRLGLRSVWDVPWAAGAEEQAGGAGSGAGSGGANGASGSSGQQQQQQQQQQQRRRRQQRQQQPQEGAQVQGDEDDEEPEFSTWKFRTGGEARRVIDHAFYSGAALAPTRRWRGPTRAEIGPGGLPCAAYPSDHVALLVEFEWL